MKYLLILLAMTVPALAQVTEIRELRKNNAQGEPLLLGQTVTVTGVVTVATSFGNWGPGFLEDGTGGVGFYGSRVSGVAVGDSITVTGTVKLFYGLTQLDPISNLTSHGSRGAPAPRSEPLSFVDRVDTAAGWVENEGWLCRFEKIWIAHTPGETFQGDRNYDISDAGGYLAQMRIHRSVGDIIGAPIPDDSITLVGVISQYKPDTPHFGGYQVMPRMAADLGVPVSYMPIGDAIRDDAGDGFPDRWGQNVTVTGVVTVPTGVFDTTRLDIYVQDTTAGVNVFGWSIGEPLDVGDSVAVTGKVDWYRGKTELTSPVITVLARNVGEPEPRILTCAEMNRERYEGELVGLVGVMTLASELAGNQNYLVEDATGSVTLRIDGDTDIPGLRPVTAPDTFTLIGIKSQYTDSARPLEGYQVQPRFRSDFSRTAGDLPLRTIREVQRPGPDGVTPLLHDSIVRVRGRITGPASAFTIGRSKSLFIQDTTQGVNVFGCSYPSDEERYLDELGVEWEVVGQVIEYNGLTEIANGTMFVTDTVPDTVLPVSVPYNTPLTERMESDLLKVVGEVIEPPVLSGSGYNITLKNGSAGITVRVGDQTGIAVGWITRGMRLRVIGIGGQYTWEPPYNTGYQLMPRFDSDLADTSAAFPPTEELTLDSVLPNPFRPWEGEVASLRLNAPRNWRLTVNVLDLEGREVRTLLSEGAGGYHDLKWDGTDRQLRPLPAGIYLVNVRGVPPGGGVRTLTRPAVIAASLR
ncbi:MAG TPA: hypothetical protein ENN51_08775 [candidate division WOR-3 bacterium]|uniref:FlgD/Vpr Ig-like domain-containing protein n=1 Tax=candidate division WOR-3 bacterium TaxID=2052148 RepID=A0A7V0XFP1_UNCW3|nr:hypothetical protein [candidate division WOR-3 bacterium]